MESSDHKNSFEIWYLNHREGRKAWVCIYIQQKCLAATALLDGGSKRPKQRKVETSDELSCLVCIQSNLLMIFIPKYKPTCTCGSHRLCHQSRQTRQKPLSSPMSWPVFSDLIANLCIVWPLQPRPFHRPGPLVARPPPAWPKHRGQSGPRPAWQYLLLTQFVTQKLENLIALQSIQWSTLSLYFISSFDPSETVMELRDLSPLDPPQRLK